MHLDLNSCFATIEQQANPCLRGKPVAVAVYPAPSGCIVAPSIEAKRYGVKVGMRVKEGRLLCPKLIILPPDPPKYRSVHLRLKRLLENYTDKLVPKSIDEFVLDFEGYPAFRLGMFNVAAEIKRKIKKEIGEWITASVGVGPNRFLAKTAAGLHKPDGLDEINGNNFKRIYTGLNLMDLSGIKKRNLARLNKVGVSTVLDFYDAPISQLRAAFQSICGYYWYLRLRGWEIDGVEFARRSFGNSFALPKPLVSPEDLSPILVKLVEKTGRRLRAAGLLTKGVNLRIVYRDRRYWQKSKTLVNSIFDSRDIYKTALDLLTKAPCRKPVRELAVSCFNLMPTDQIQLDLFDNVLKRERLVAAVDRINTRWGKFVIAPAKMLGTKDIAIDRIAFGGVEEL